MITLNKYEQGLADLLEKATPDQIAVIKIPSETNPGYVQSILDEKLFVDIPQLKTQVYEYTPPGYVGH